MMLGEGRGPMPAPQLDFHDDGEIVRLKRPGPETPNLRRMWDLLRDGDTYADARSKRWLGIRHRRETARQMRARGSISIG